MKRDTLGSLTAGFLLCLIAVTLFLLAVMGGRAGMCHLYEGRTDRPGYCEAAK